MYRVIKMNNLSADWILVHLHHYYEKKVAYRQKF